jgi:outer membrane protein assembly factor BamB
VSLAVDKDGNVYAASGSEITKFDPSGAPTKFASGLVGATGGMAFNSAGELFVVTDRQSDNPAILKFNAATGTSSVAADAQNIGAANRWPGGLAFGSDGTLYIPTQIGNTILTFPANAVDATVLASTEGNPYAVAIGKTREAAKPASK